MRRYFKPLLTVAAAAAAVLIVVSSSSSFNAAPAAKTKTIACSTTSTQVQGLSKKVGAKTISLPTLPSIPFAQIPCDRLTSIPQGLQDLPGKLQEVGARVQNILFPTTTSTTETPPTTAPQSTSTTLATTTTTSGACNSNNPSGCTTQSECLAASINFFWDGSACYLD